MIKSTSILAAFAALTTSAFGVINIHLDTAAQTFTVTGTETMVPNSLGFVQYKISPPDTIGVQSEAAFSNDVAFSTSVGTPGTTHGAFSNEDFIILASTAGELRFTFGLSDLVSQTITGNEVAQSYAALNADGISLLENSAGTVSSPASIPFSFGGSGSSTTPITLSAVPEPSSFAALAGIAVVGFTACSRRRRS
ncbi:MAG: PEP-CTERM sorting domain-containing protein [Opitutaceae bacterium]